MNWIQEWISKEIKYIKTIVRKLLGTPKLLSYRDLLGAEYSSLMIQFPQEVDA